MIYNKLPNTDISVSKICLGTMNMGEQNTQAEGHQQLDYALERGINFIDTAEIYAIPIKAETQGATEKIIGSWLEKRQDRDKIIIASKATGPGIMHIRNSPNFSSEHLTEALHGSLKRLKTDYIDLYQLHWPERKTNFFGPLGYRHQSENAVTDFKKTLETLKGFIDQGKIKHIGLSNETPWGLMQYLKIAEQYDLPKVVTVQNPYNLVNRTLEIGLSEMFIREDVGLLAYSPLAGGLLSGKYTQGRSPENSRFILFPGYFSRYSHANTSKAIEQYHNLANEMGITTTQMALAFVNQQPFTTSNIIGATTMTQLKENIDSISVTLTKEQLKQIEAIHLQYPNPAP